MIIIKINIYFGPKLASQYSINEKSYEQLFEPVDDNINKTNLKYHIMLLEKYIEEQSKNNLYDKIQERVKLLNLPKNNTEILLMYKDYITDANKLADHYNTLRLFRPNYYIESKFIDVVNNNFPCKYINNVYNKIKIIKNIEQRYQIKNFNINKYENNILTDEEHNLIKTLFRIKKNKPQNDYELIIMYVTMIKNMCGCQIINYKQKQIKNERFCVYHFNDEYIDFHKKLSSYYTFNIDNDKKNIILKNNVDDIDLDEIYNFIKDGKKFIKSIMNTLLLNKY